jgi:hypothetical protein
MKPKISDVARFLSKLKPLENGCILYTGGIAGNNNYGCFHYEGKDRRAHRFSYCLASGEWDDLENLSFVIMHECDNPACVNPDHLLKGTQQENVLDMVKKKRFDKRKGIKKLSEKEVNDILYWRYERKLTIQWISDRLGVSSGCITEIIKGRNWKHISVPYLKSINMI